MGVVEHSTRPKGPHALRRRKVASPKTVEAIRKADQALTDLLHLQEIRELCTHEQLRAFREAERDLYELRSQVVIGVTA